MFPKFCRLIPLLGIHEWPQEKFLEALQERNLFNIA